MRWEPIDQLTHGPYHSLSLSSDFFVKFVVVQERVNERFVKVVLFHFITSFSPPPVVFMVLSSPFLLTYKTYIFVNGHFIVWHSSIGWFFLRDQNRTFWHCDECVFGGYTKRRLCEKSGSKLSRQKKCQWGFVFHGSLCNCMYFLYYFAGYCLLLHNFWVAFFSLYIQFTQTWRLADFFFLFL